MTNGRPTRLVTFEEEVDLMAAFNQSTFEMLDVSDRRAVVLLQGAIFMIDTQRGTLRQVTELSVELWEPPRDEKAITPEELLSEFIDRLDQLTEHGL